MGSVFISLDLFQAGFFSKLLPQFWLSEVKVKYGKSKIEVDSKQSAKGKGNYGVLAARKPRKLRRTSGSP